MKVHLVLTLALLALVVVALRCFGSRDAGAGVEGVAPVAGTEPPRQELEAVGAAAAARFAEVQAEEPAAGGRLSVGGRSGVEVPEATDRQLVARVVDAATGEPVPGLRVVMGWIVEGNLEELEAGLSGPDGRVFFHCSFAPAPGEFEVPCAVQVDALLADPVSVEFDGLDPPQDDVMLGVPRVGEVEVRVVGPGGELLDGSFVVQLAALPAGAIQKRRVDGGAGVFRSVELGLVVLARVCRSLGGTRVEIAGAGPVSAAERAILTVPFDPPDVVLAGRFVDHEDRPFTKGWLVRKWSVEPSDRIPGGRRRVGTDEGGCFEILLGDIPATLGDERRELVFTYDTVRTPWALEARLDFDVPLPAGRHELGEIALMPPPVLVSGMVVDGAGEPLAGVRFQVEVPAEVDVERPIDEDERGWIPTPNAAGISDKHGAFEVRGRLAAEELRLEAVAYDHLSPDPIECRVGDFGLRFVLSLGGAVAGSLLLDDYGWCQAIRVGPVERGLPPEHRIHPSGKFSLVGLTPGTCDVGFRLRGESEAFLVVPDVGVEAGCTSRDRRLQELDLRELLRVVRLSFTNEAGEPLEYVIARIQPWQERAGTWYSSGGSIEFVTERESLNLRVSKLGCRDKFLREVHDEQRVILRPAYSVRVIVIDPPELPEGSVLLVQLRCLREDLPGADEVATSARWSSPATKLDGRGQTLLRIPTPGLFEATLVQRIETPIGWESIPLEVEPQLIEVLDVEGEQAFELVFE